MHIIGFSFNKVNAEKDSVKIDKKIETNTDLKIISVSNEKVQFSNTEAIKFSFAFSVIYGKLGKVLLEGEVIVSDTPKKVSEIIDVWKKSNKVDNEVTLPVINAILYNCNIKALELGYLVNLPSHVSLPLVKNNG